MAPKRKKSAKEAAPSSSTGVLDYDMLHSIVGYALRRAQVHVYQNYAKTIGELDIRPAQFAALTIIGSNPGLSQTQLAASMGIDRSGVVILLDAIEGKGLAMRVPSPTDRRTHAIVLTAQGQTMLAKLKEVVGEHDNDVTAGFSDAERETLVNLLRRIYEK